MKEMDSEEVGDRLETAIRSAGLTITQAEERFDAAGVPGASHSNLYKIRNGDTSPSAEFLYGVCQVLEVSADWLLTGEGEMKRPNTMSEEEAKYYGFQDLPDAIQGEVEQLALTIFNRTKTTGLSWEDSKPRIVALCRGIAAWLRFPLHSDKTRDLESQIERVAYCDVALRALGMLVPERDATPRPAEIDRALVKLTRVERDLAGRPKPSEPETEGPEHPARVRVKSDRSDGGPAPEPELE